MQISDWGHLGYLDQLTQIKVQWNKSLPKPISKLRLPDTFKIPGYQVFEKTRSGLGGGLLTAIDINLSPMLISSGGDDIELLVVQVMVRKLKIKRMN